MSKYLIIWIFKCDADDDEEFFLYSECKDKEELLNKYKDLRKCKRNIIIDKAYKIEKRITLTDLEEEIIE